MEVWLYSKNSDNNPDACTHYHRIFQDKDLTGQRATFLFKIKFSKNIVQYFSISSMDCVSCLIPFIFLFTFEQH